MTITVDEDVKKQFQALAKRMGSNASTLTNMFFVSAVNTGRVNYYDFQDNLGEKLYQEYLDSPDELKEPAFSIQLDRPIDKAMLKKTLSEKLWK